MIDSVCIWMVDGGVSIWTVAGSTPSTARSLDAEASEEEACFWAILLDLDGRRRLHQTV